MKRVVIGIYKILNKVNNKVYIGASKNVLERIYNHRYKLSKGIHENDYLQKSWNKHGSINFDFVLVESCPSHELIEKEQFWIDYFNSYSRLAGYNIQPKSGWRQHSDETKLKIGKANAVALKGNKLSPFTIEKIRLTNKGRVFSLEHKTKISKNNARYWLGKTMSTEHRAKISQSMKGKRKGMPLSVQHKQKLAQFSKSRRKPVLQLNKQTLEVIKEFESIKAVETTLGFNSRVIQCICSGRRPSAYGYKWRYKNAITPS